jgi:hypothetical protein
MILDSSRALNKRLDATVDDSERLCELYRRILARPATTSEAQLAIRFLDSFSAELIAHKAAKSENARNVAWSRLGHTLLVSNEFVVIP